MDENLNNENSEVKNNKNNKENKIILCLLILFIVGAFAFIGYDRIFNKETPPVPTPAPTHTPVPTNNTEVEYKEWMKYILEQDITKIEISKVPCDEDTFESRTEVINTEQLKEIFKKFMSYKLMETHGAGGWTCGESLNIKYLKNGIEYELEYLGSEGWFRQGSDLTIENDKDLENAFHNSADIKDTDQNEGSNFTAYVLYDASILFDEYFK